MARHCRDRSDEDGMKLRISAAFVKRLLRRVGLLASQALDASLGEFRWTPPAWIRSSARWAERAGAFVQRDPRRSALIAAALLGLGLGAWAGWHWVQSLPKPVETAATVTGPDRTCIECTPPGKPNVVVVHFSGSVAPLSDSGKVIDADKAGLRLEPAIAGEWRWADDKTLVLTPKADWPIGENYTIRFAQHGFTAPQIRLAKYAVTFQSPAFAAEIASNEFYQDPVVAAEKKIVTTLQFTQPVDPEALERRIKLKLFGKVTDKIEEEQTPAPAFTVTYDKLKLHAYVKTGELPMLAKGGRVDLQIDAGVHAARGGNKTQEPLQASVEVPGLYSLTVTDLRLTIARDQGDNPSQALVIATSHSITESEMTSHVHAWLLPAKHPDPQRQKAWDRADTHRPFPWNVNLVTPEILAGATPLPLAYVANEREHVELHSFALKTGPNAQIYLQVDKGLRSFGGYLMADPVDRVLAMPEYPKEVRIASPGALLAMSGQRKLTLFTRDVPAVQVQVGRLLPDQLQHLVTQTAGDFAHPNFNSYSFDASNITESTIDVLSMPTLPAGTANYQAFDLGAYLNKPGAGRQGIFLVNVQAYDPERKQVMGSRYGDAGTTDTRLIVVTDLGLLAKKSVDGSQDVFVQSIASGEPVAGASVQVIGKNGEAVLTETTDGEGHVHFPDLKSFTNEREPVLYLAKRGADSSFLPTRSHVDVMELSRFDVGGVSDKAEHAALSAYLFSDRGIYRPGDEIRAAAIIKTQDWRRLPAGLPIRVEITDPRGLAVKRDLLHLSAAGFEELRYQTHATAAAGAYTINLYLLKANEREDLIGTTSVKVQEFLPDRLRITTHFSAERTEGWVSPEKLQVVVGLQNLFGTPATDRRLQATMRLSPAIPSFAKYKEYEFRDPQAAKDGFTETLSEQRTGADGQASLDLNLSRFARATYRASVVVEGYEADGGRGVTGEAAQLVSNLPFLVGWKADGRMDYISRGSTRSVEVIAINETLARIAAPGLKLKRLERRYVSVLLKGDSGVYKYESRLKEIPIDEVDLPLPESAAHLDLDTSKPGDFSDLITDADGQVYARIDFTVAGAGNLSRSLEKNAELQIVLDKHDYAPGDTISMQIQAPYVGAGLITIERDHVYAWQWFKATTTSSVQKIRVPDGLEGNGYVSVSFVRDPASDQVYSSPLSYGVQPFSIALDARRNSIKLKTPTLVKPGGPLTIGYKTAQAARIVLFAVDEGILQVARYKTPDPLAHFFQKRSLEVSTRQILDLILPEFRAAMLSAPGGDQRSLLGANLNPFKRKTDRPVAWWSGILDAGEQERTLDWTVPDYFNGTLRIIAVAVNDTSIGVADQTTIVRGDLILSPNAPLTVTPGDEFEVSVGIANNVVGSGADAPVTVKLEPSAQFAIIGSAQATLKIAEMREASTRFRVRTRDVLGSGSLKFSASIGSKTGALTTTVSVRPATAYVTSLLAGSFSGDATVSVTRTLYPQYRTLEASTSILPLALAHGLVSYLDRYPYSCTEQLVSEAMPAIVLAHRPEFGELKSREGASLASLIDELRARQIGDGSFRYWAGGVETMDFVSAYALQVLLEASERGEAVPADLLAAGKPFLFRLARRDGDKLSDERTSAYAIYLLARQGVVVSNEAAALQQRLSTRYEKEWPQDIVAAYLAAAYQLMKQDSAANQAIAKVSFGGTTDGDRWHGPENRDGMLLYLLARHFPNRLARLPDTVLDSLVTRVKNGEYDSLSAATTILALDAYATAVATHGAPKLGLEATLADKSILSLSLPEGLFPNVSFPAETRSLKFSNDAAVRGYYLVNQSGFDRVPTTQTLSQGLEIIREFLTADGRPADKIQVGDEITVHLKFRAIDRPPIEDAVLVDLLPGGFDLVVPNAPAPNQPLRSASPGTDTAGGDGTAGGDDTGSTRGCPCLWLVSRPANFPDYADLREDRVILYGQATDQIQEFSYRIKATNAGNYVVPASYGESMYNPSIRARSSAGHLVVDSP
jgi:uncharacterized protein YfaS (alpha-2-macroglobulin family)